MKQILRVLIGQEIPDNAKFVSVDKETFYYEIPIKKETTNTAKDDSIETIERVLTYLNKLTGSKFTPKAKAHAAKIRARISEGAKPEDFKTCIDNMASQWLDDDKMRPYLRPETLFSNKFWGYLTAKSGDQVTKEVFDELDKLIEGIE